MPAANDAKLKDEAKRLGATASLHINRLIEAALRGEESAAMTMLLQRAGYSGGEVEMTVVFKRRT